MMRQHVGDVLQHLGERPADVGRLRLQAEHAVGIVVHDRDAGRRA